MLTTSAGSGCQNQNTIEMYCKCMERSSREQSINEAINAQRTSIRHKVNSVDKSNVKADHINSKAVVMWRYTQHPNTTGVLLPAKLRNPKFLAKNRSLVWGIITKI